jgi:hypothetical protein
MYPFNLALKRYFAAMNGVFTLIFSLFTLGLFAQPTFQNVGENQTIACGTPLPDLTGATAVSSCEGPVTVSSFGYESGNVLDQCNVSAAYGPGVDWAVWLPLLDAPSVAWNFIGDQQLTFYANGTGQLTGTIQNAANSSLQMNVVMRFENGRNWQEWSALSRGYKNDIGLAGNNYLDWKYYELNPMFSHFTGIGTLAGSEISLAHLPSNYYYGFQTGVAANNKNSNNGISGWFSYSGTYNGESVSGNGDVNLDRSCETPEHTCGSSEYTALYRAEDNCGAVAFTTRVINIVDDVAPVVDAFESPIFVSCSDQDNVFITANDACSDITISYSDVFVQEGCPGLLTRAYSVVDGCGNTSTAEQQIYLVQEGTLDFTTFPVDVNISCDANVDLNPLVEYTQVCYNTQLSHSDNILQGSCPANYTLVRTYILTDACGNTASRAWTMNFFDDVAPIISNTPDDLNLVCGDQVPTGEPSAADNCSDITWSSNDVTVALDCGSSVTTIWTATDACGNSSSTERTISYSDNVDPQFSFIPESVTLNCGDNFELEIAQVIDDCSEVTLAWADEPLNDCAGSYIRIWRAFDGCGNQALESTTVTFVDTEAPILVGIPESNGGSCGSDSFDAEVTATDNCDSAPVVTLDVTSVPSGCGSIATYTWTATDACGNTTSATRTYSLTDNVGPDFGASSDTVYAICGDAASLLEIPLLEATDACSEVASVVYADNEVAAPCGSMIERTYTATDGCGNSTQLIQVIVLSDNTSPVFVSLPPNAMSLCGVMSEQTELPVVEDNCSDVDITYTDDVITNEGCSGSIMRHWVATDACGNSSSQDQLLTFSDDTAPAIISLPADATASCDMIPEVNLSDIVYADNCSDVVVGVEEILVPGYCSGGYNIERIWTVTDACGNSNSATQILYVVDEFAPVLIGVPADTAIVCGANLPVSVTTATDNCTADGDIILSVEEQIVSADCGSIILRIYSASDACGNTTSITQQITLIDNAAPLFVTVPVATSINCGDESGLTDAYAIDACSQVTISENRIISDDCSGSFIRVFTATDGCGNSTTAEQVVTVIDTEGPSFAGVSQTISRNCNDEVPVADVIAVDGCSSVAMSSTDEMQTLLCGYQILRTYVAEDACGNSTEFVQVIEFNDNEGPVFEDALSDIYLTCGDNVPAAQSPMAIDACSGSTEVTVDEVLESGFCSYSYSIIRTFAATDFCGNTSTLVQTIFFNDNVAPMFDAFEAQIVVPCGQADNITVAATDNCGTALVTYTDQMTPGSCGMRTRTYTAVDACGNVSQATQTITITDAVAPHFTSFPSSGSVSCSDVLSVEQVGITYTDNCSFVEVQWTENIIQGDCPNAYTSVRTCVLTDACGNSTEASYTLEVSDTEGPQISGVPGDLVLDCGDSLPAENVVVTDNCTSQPEFSLSETSETIGCTLYLTRRWTAVDECGNVSQEVQIVTYIDETLPVLSQYPDDVILPCGSAIPEAAVITAYDNCSGDVSVTFTEIGNPNNACATIERTWCATDCSGNEACYTQLISFELQGSAVQSEPMLRTWQQSADQLMVTFTSSAPGRWGVDVFDLNGKKVTNVFVGDLKAGESRAVVYDANTLISGVYIFQFSNGEEKAIQRMPIIR